MPRPRKRRRIRYKPQAYYFKPRGIPLRELEEVALRHDEVEALRLKYEKGYDQIQAAQKMEISQSTFHRILSSAHKKLAQAVLKGHAIEIKKTM